MFFSSIIKINKLTSKGMSNIHLEVTVDKNWRSPNFNFLTLKSLPTSQFLKSSSADIIEF